MGTYCINQSGDIVSKQTITKQEHSKQNVALTDDAAITKQINLFSKQVVEKMAKDKIPATPENYAIYFEKLLDEKPLKQRREIQKILSTEALKENIYVAQVENDIKESFRKIKTILETVSSMYSKVNQLRSFTKQKKESLAKGSGKVTLLAYEEMLDDVVKTLEKKQLTIKEKYSQVQESIKTFHQNSVFDTKYDVYNKNFLFKAIETEKKNIATFGHESTLLAFKVSPASLQVLQSQKDKDIVIKNIATMILKRSRRSDVVAHMGNDIFVILLKHTTFKQTENVINSIDTLIENTNFIINSQQIEIYLEYAVTKILINTTKDQMLSELINKLS